MLRFVLLFGLVAYCAAQRASIAHCCSAEDRQIVQRQWSALWENNESSRMKIGFGKRLLLKLAEIKPEVKDLFKRVNMDNPDSGEFQAHCMRILNAIDMCINMLNNPTALNLALEHLSAQHGNRDGVKKEHFKVFGQLLIGHGLPRVLDDYDAMSWKSCFKGLLFKISADSSD